MRSDDAAGHDLADRRIVHGLEHHGGVAPGGVIAGDLFLVDQEDRALETVPCQMEGRGGPGETRTDDENYRIHSGDSNTLNAQRRRMERRGGCEI